MKEEKEKLCTRYQSNFNICHLFVTSWKEFTHKTFQLSNANIYFELIFQSQRHTHTQTPSSDRSVYILKWKTVLGFSQINNSNRLAYSSSFTYAVLLGRSVARSFTSQSTSQWVIYHFPACGYIHFSIQSSPLCPSLLLTFQIQSAAHVLLFH